MARGWESKSVESQIEAAEDRAARSQAAKLTLEQASSLRELESAQLSRTRVLQDIELSQNPKYREMLGRSLRFLDEKIAEMQAAASTSNRLG